MLEQVEQRFLQLLRLQGNSPSCKVAPVHGLLVVLDAVLLHELLQFVKLRVDFLLVVPGHPEVHEDWLLGPVVRSLKLHHLPLSRIFKELLLHFLIHSIVLGDGDNSLINHRLQLQTALLRVLRHNAMRLRKAVPLTPVH